MMSRLDAKQRGMNVKTMSKSNAAVAPIKTNMYVSISSIVRYWLVGWQKAVEKYISKIIDVNSVYILV